VYVLDSGALLSIWTQKQTSASFLTTPEVIEELRNRPSQTRVETLISLGRLKEQMPSDTFIQGAAKAASETGDATSLSPTDIGIIALAFEASTNETDVTLVSTDLAVLNTAKHLGLRILDPSNRFRKKITWILVCPGCGHKSKDEKGALECPVCGTQMRRHSQRPSSKRPRR
jgi:rRNA maturation endonuclease Nob1